MTTRTRRWRAWADVMVTAVACAAVAASGALFAAQAPKESRRWTDRFDVSSCRWASEGRNDFFILEKGYQAVLEGRDEGRPVRLEITVLGDIRTVDGVETRIVEEKEIHDGHIVEISRNFFAVCGPGNDVFYFGEDVDIYRNDKVANHAGSWTAGKEGARAGLFMPGRALLGARFYQEIAPKVAMDRVEIVADADSLKTPAGDFHECLKTEETTPLEPDVKEYKIYVRGIGIVKDGELLLSKHGMIAPVHK